MINLKFSNIEEPFYDAKVSPEGVIYYYNEKGEYHNSNGPAKIYPDGKMEYLINGKYHRINGPAIIHPDGYKVYYVNNKLHRLDGPAVIYPNGKVEYWVDDKELTKEEFDELTKNNNG